jgi:hypothetical protein
MAFPATYDFNYYKGDTFEFRIYPKKSDGTVFSLSQYYDTNSNYNSDPIDNVSPSVLPYESARFTIAPARGTLTTAQLAQRVTCFARISPDSTHVQCAIRPSDSVVLLAGVEYVYDVEVRKPAGLPGSGTYDMVQTLLTGKIIITDQVTGA